MWDLYGKGSGIVAVKSTVEKLKEAVTQSPLRIFLGKVNYVDWSRAPWDNNALTMCFRKDLSYQHEAEVRAVIWDVDIVETNMSDALIAARLRSDYPHSGEDPFILRKEDGQRGVAIPFSIQRFVTEVGYGISAKRAEDISDRNQNHRLRSLDAPLTGLASLAAGEEGLRALKNLVLGK
jgi:hypothetical protein